MIEPRWLMEFHDDKSEIKWPSNYPTGQENEYFETCLRLRLDEKNQKNLAKLSENLELVYDENLLLFLNKLERMMYQDRLSDRSVELSREKLCDNWTKISTQKRNYTCSKNGFSDVYWFVHSESFVPVISRNGQSNTTSDYAHVAVAVKFEKLLDSTDPVQLRLSCKDKLPVYAFLPTTSAEFKFIIQGDFLLATSRESMLENNEWNQHLMNKIPSIVVSLVCELAAWVWADMTPAGAEPKYSCAHLEQLGASYKILIKLEDVFDMLPLVSHCQSAIFKRFITDVYKQLHHEAFLMSRSGIMCKPSQLVNISHLSFDPALYVSEELLFAATGWRYSHEMLSSCLDSERASLLDVKKFQVSTIVACMEYFSEQSASNTPEQNHRMLCGLLVCLDLLSSNNMEAPIRRQQGHHHPHSDSNKRHSGIIPLQAMKKIPKSSTAGGSLSLEVVAKLRKLRIWPLTTGAVVSVDEEVVFVNPLGGLSTSFSDSQTKCLEMFREGRLLMMCEDLFAVASTMGKDFDKRIRAFLLRNFEGGGASCGGIEELTAHKVIKNVILPAYASIELPEEIEEKDSSSCETIQSSSPPIERVTAAAYLAFLFLSFGDDIAGRGKNPSAKVIEIQRSLHEKGVIIPVNKGKEVSRKHTLKWVASGCRRLKHSAATGAPSREFHLGVEFKDSSTCQLAKLPISTALRQLNWTIVDPLVAGLIFSDKRHNLVDLFRDSSVVHDDACSAFGKIPESELTNWNCFLKKLGVVDFFGTYNMGTAAENKIKAPHLLGLLEHLVRNAVPVCTQRQASDEMLSSSDSNINADTDIVDELYVPVYLPSHVVRPVLSISKDVHSSLQASDDLSLAVT
jgi:hypothetical protein